MAINTAQGLAAASDNPVPRNPVSRKRRSGLARLGKPGAFAMVLAVLAVILAACGGSSGDSSQTLQPISSGSEVQADTKLGTVIVDKVTNPAGDSQSFAFTLTGGPDNINQAFNLIDASAPHNSGLQKPGTYNASETVPAGWVLTSATCDDGSAVGSIGLDAGETVTCTFMAKDPAPDFQFTLFQGEAKLGAGEMNLHKLQGRPVILNFWAGLCPPCRAEMPDLQEFYDEFSGRITLIGIDIGQFTGLGSQRDAKDLLEELEITYPAGFTEDGSVIKEYRILGMPTTIFIDAEGVIFKTWGGALNADVLRKQTNAMLSQ